MKFLKSKYFNFALILGTLALVLVINFANPKTSFQQTVTYLTSISIPSILICVFLYLMYMGCDALSIWYFLRRVNCRVSLPYAYFASVAGQYYSNVTPGAAGGQPMQIYYLHQRSVPTGIATSALMTRYFGFQSMLVLIGTILWATHIDYVRAAFEPDWYWALFVGFGWNLLVLVLLVTFCFFRPAVRVCADLLIKLGVKVRLIKNPDSTRKKWMKTVDSFHASMLDILHRPADLAVQLLIGAAQVLFLLSITWFIYRDLGNGEAAFDQVITLNVLQFMTAAYTPLPGGSGAMEVIFFKVFGGLFGTHEKTLAAQLLWRFFTYYMSILIGLVVLTVMGLRSGKSLKELANMRENVEAENEAREKEQTSETDANG